MDRAQPIAPIAMNNIPAMGQDITIGYLYDIRTGKLINRSPWEEKRRKEVTTANKKTTDFKVAISDTYEQRSNIMDINAELSLTLIGQANFAGSARYLSSRNSSAKSSSVTLKLTTTDRSERLNEDQLKLTKTEADNVNILLKKKEATHIISQVTYGNNAYFKFEKKIEEGQTKREVEGALKAGVTLGFGKVSGKGSVDHQTQKETKTTSSQCEFHGDFELTTIPTTFESAMDVLKEILQTKKNKDDTVPLSFSLTPIHQLDSKIDILVRSISNFAVEKAIKLKNHQERCIQELNDLLASEIFRDNGYVDLWKFLSEVKSLFSDNDSKFKTKLSNIVPRIKGGETKEGELLKIVRLYDESSFGQPMYRTWYKIIKEEIGFFEQILKNFKTFEKTSSKIHICENESMAKTLKFSHRTKHSGKGWYELKMSLLSCVDQRLIDHLEKELNNPEEENISHYPVKLSFLTDDNGFLKSLTKKVNNFKKLANLEDNSQNEKLCFVVVTDYPASCENDAKIYFENEDENIENIDVNLDLDLEMKKIDSDEEGLSRFGFQVLPRSIEEGTNLPDISIELRYRCVAGDSKFKYLETGFIRDEESIESSISARIQPSNIFYLAQARFKLIGGAVGSWLSCKAFCCKTFENIRYVSEEHALSVDISLDDNFIYESESHNSPFNVEFQYRHAGREDEPFSKVNAKSDNGKVFKVLLNEKEKGELEYQCRYVVNNRYNLEPHSWMEGGREGDWSTLQNNSNIFFR